MFTNTAIEETERVKNFLCFVDGTSGSASMCAKNELCRYESVGAAFVCTVNVVYYLFALHTRLNRGKPVSNSI